MRLLRCVLMAIALHATSCASADVLPSVRHHRSAHRHIEASTRERFGEIEAQLSQLVSKDGVTAAGVGIIKSGRLIWTGYFGEQSPGVPTSRNTLFNVASMTKTVTTETMLRLAADRKLRLDESMAQYWVDPDIANDPLHALLTPRIALTHTTGFPNWRFFLPDGHLKFLHRPGSTFGYSGEGFEYVARYAEKKLGKSFEELANDYVFRPISVRDAALSPRQDLYGRIAAVTDDKGTHKPYCRPGGWCRPPGQWSAADDMVITVEDYVRFLISVMNATGLTRSIAHERFRIQATTNAEFAAGYCGSDRPGQCPKRQGYGLGWEIIDLGNEELIGHGGSDWSEVATAYFYSRSRDGLIVFLCGPNAEALGVMARAIKVIDPESVLVPRYERWHATALAQSR